MGEVRGAVGIRPTARATSLSLRLHSRAVAYPEAAAQHDGAVQLGLVRRDPRGLGLRVERSGEGLADPASAASAPSRRGRRELSRRRSASTVSSATSSAADSMAIASSSAVYVFVAATDRSSPAAMSSTCSAAAARRRARIVRVVASVRTRVAARRARRRPRRQADRPDWLTPTTSAFPYCGEAPYERLEGRDGERDGRARCGRRGCTARRRPRGRMCRAPRSPRGDPTTADGIGDGAR